MSTDPKSTMTREFVLDWTKEHGHNGILQFTSIVEMLEAYPPVVRAAARIAAPDGPDWHAFYTDSQSQLYHEREVNQELLEALRNTTQTLRLLLVPMDPADVDARAEVRNEIKQAEAAIAHAQAATPLPKVSPDSLSANPIAEGGLKTTAQAAKEKENG